MLSFYKVDKILLRNFERSLVLGRSTQVSVKVLVRMKVLYKEKEHVKFVERREQMNTVIDGHAKDDGPGEV